MKVLITGVGGFIASNLATKCMSLGWEIIGVDDLSTGHMEMASPMRYTGPGYYSFKKMDINDTKLLTELARGCDVIFHLAALPRVSFSVDHPLESHQANATGTLSVLEAARKSDVKRVIFSCSSSVFGGVSEFPTKENTPMRPISPYALQKATGLEYCRLYSELYGLETVSLLYYNILGPHQRSDSAYATVIPAFMEAAIKGKECIIHGTGEQSRDFTFVGDAVNANILAAEHSDPLLGEKFNIACEETHSVLEIYEKINKLAGGTLTKRHEPRRAGDPMKSLASISRARQMLLYEPKFDIDSALKITWDWWKAECPIKFG